MDPGSCCTTEPPPPPAASAPSPPPDPPPPPPAAAAAAPPPPGPGHPAGPAPPGQSSRGPSTARRAEMPNIGISLPEELKRVIPVTEQRLAETSLTAKPHPLAKQQKEEDLHVQSGKLSLYAT